MEPEDSPSKIAKNSPYALFCSQASSESILEELTQAYRQHRSSNVLQSTIARLIRNIIFWAGKFTGIMKELWAQIIPEVIRGEMDLSEKGDELKIQPFSDYNRLGKIFFVLVLQAECSEQQIQQGYLKATEVCPEGLSCSVENLSNTSPECRSLPGLTLPFRYAIIFFKFDIFRKLRWIGTLQKISLEIAQQPIQELKQKLDEVVHKLEEIEKSFVGSYLEKEQRFAFEQEMLP